MLIQLDNNTDDEVETYLRGVQYVNIGKNFEHCFNPSIIRQSYYKLLAEFESDLNKHADYYLFETSPYAHYWNIIKPDSQVQNIISSESPFTYIKNDAFNYGQQMMDFYKHKEYYPCKIQKYIKAPFILKEGKRTKYHVIFKTYLLIESIQPLQAYLTNKVLVNLRFDPFFVPSQYMSQFHNRKEQLLSQLLMMPYSFVKTKENITLEEFKIRLANQGFEFDDKKFWQQVSEQCILILLSTFPNMQWIKDKSYQLLEVKFTMDEEQNVWLCSINNQVKFSENYSIYINAYKKSIIHDLLQNMESQIKIKVENEMKFQHKKKLTAGELKQKLKNDQQQNELAFKIQKSKEIQRQLFKKIDIERAKIKSAQKQVISFKEINQCLTSRQNPQIPLYFQHKKGHNEQMAKTIQKIIRLDDHRINRNNLVKPPVADHHNILQLNQQIEKLKELQSEAKPQHIQIVESLLFSISHCYNIDALKNKHPIFVKINDDDWVSRWLMKLLYYGGEQKQRKKQKRQNKFKRFLVYCFRRMKRKENIQEKQEEEKQMDPQEKALEAINLYKRRKHEKILSDEALSYQRIPTSQLSEYFDDDYDVKVPQKEKWIKDLNGNKAKNDSSEDQDDSEFSFSEMEDQDRKQMQNAIEYAQLAQKLGIIKERGKLKSVLPKDENKRKTTRLFFGLTYSSSSDDGKDDKLLEKAKSLVKLEELKGSLQSVMSQYKISSNKITYNLTENEKDLKLRQMQRSQSQFQLPRRQRDLNFKEYLENQNEIQINKDIQTRFPQWNEIKDQDLLPKMPSVKLQQVTPRQATAIQSDYLTERRMLKQYNEEIRNTELEIQMNQKNQKKNQISQSEAKKQLIYSKLKQTVQKIIQQKRRPQKLNYFRTNQQLLYQSLPQTGRSTVTSEMLLGKVDQRQLEHLNTVNLDSAGQNQDQFEFQKYNHFIRLLPFNPESKHVLKDIDQLTIKFNYFELVLITKRIFKLTEQFDFYEAISKLRQPTAPDPSTAKTTDQRTSRQFPSPNSPTTQPNFAQNQS
ncbi:UNKNOWN [Stylonychia lemnae]|uniref:Uncharacterized protein n=1 Tax=Stylonychia lemnae TaxID=5949 RepID=A0A078AI65_STYLE|nr:UNKNOWN [Stylonychia lemnae]|eukprot:CDW81950.1 UNKNOWN [Stylonychia lemnae]